MTYETATGILAKWDWLHAAQSMPVARLRTMIAALEVVAKNAEDFAADVRRIERLETR